MVSGTWPSPSRLKRPEPPTTMRGVMTVPCFMPQPPIVAVRAVERIRVTRVSMPI